VRLALVLQRGLLALLSGLAAACAFEPVGWSYLVLPAVAGLTLACRGLRLRAAFVVGLVFGLAFMLALLPWLQVVGVDAWIGLSFLEALFYGVLGVLLALVTRLPAWPLWAAASWVLSELLRSTVPWGGFPWGRLAFTTVDTPLAPAMAWVGAPGTSYLVALLGSGLAWLLLEHRWRRVAPLGVAAAVVLVAAAPALLPDGLPPASAGPRVRLAAVQGNVPGKGLEAFAERRAVLDNHVRATVALGDRISAGNAQKPAFVLWPENSTDIDPFSDPSVYDEIQTAVDAVGVPVLVGAMVDGPGPHDVRNQGIVWSPATPTSPGGPGERYSKRHPVPFGEYIPYRDEIAHFFQRLNQIPRDMVPGTRPGVLDLAGTRIGDVICFEVAYDSAVHDVIDPPSGSGGRLLVVQTNNATYMGTGQLDQQFAIARLRAIETSRYVVVAATNGISGIVAPDGSVLQRAPERHTVVMERDVPLRTVITPAIRLSSWLEYAISAVAVVAAFIGLIRGRRRDGTEPPRPAEARVPVGAAP
jgi:apolipoprotein N-acyltransferase